MTSRRRFLAIIPLAGAATLTRAQGAVDPKDPTAAGLGFVTDATKADKAKFPKYAAGQTCGTCALYQGAAGSATGACPIFGNKQVPAAGWCNAYVKKG